MEVVEIDDNIASRIGKLAESENKSLTEFVNLTLLDVLDKRISLRSDEEKLKKFAESYAKKPQLNEEWKIWQSEQAWEEE